MKGGMFLILFLIVCFGLFMLASQDPSAGGMPGAPVAAVPVPLLGPNPGALDATAEIRRIEAQQLENQADQVRAREATWAAANIRATADAAAWRTAEAQRQTESAQATATMRILQVTLEAARTQEALRVIGTTTAMANTQVAVQHTQAADDLKQSALAAEATALPTKRARQNEWEDAKHQAGKSLAWFTANWLFWIIVVLAAFAAGGGGAYFWYKIRHAVTLIPTDNYGNHYGVAIAGQLANLDQMTAPALDPRQAKPVIDRDGALEVAKLNQARNLAWGLGKSGYRKDAFAGLQQMTQALNAEQLQAPAPDESGLPIDVSWSVMDTWPGQKWTFGQGTNGKMICLDPDDDSAPHILGAGTTGSGKTHYLLDVVIPQALATNRLVVSLSRSGIGASMFAGHPNYMTRLLNDPEDAIGYLDSAYQEIIRRLRLMEPEGIYKWSMWPGNPPAPAILLVMDEFSDLADEMDTEGARQELWKHARMVAAEGRKAGVLLALALQDPTHRSIDLRIRRNCTPVAFRVQDVAASNVILRVSGAEKLPKRHFMARLGGEVVEGVAFDVTAQDVARFLAKHPVPPLPAPAWLTAQTPPLKPEPRDVYGKDLVDLAERIRPVWQQGGSGSAMAREAGFTQYGGAMKSKIDAAVEYLAQKYGSTTSTTTTELPSTDPLPAD